MEPQDTPPYAPLDSEHAVAPPPRTASTPRTPASGGRPDRTRRNVALAAGASFVVALVGMAAARSGTGSTGAGTTVPASNDSVQQQLSTSDGPVFSDDDGGEDGFARQPRPAQPGVPFFDGGGQTQSHGS